MTTAKPSPPEKPCPHCARPLSAVQRGKHCAPTNNHTPPHPNPAAPSVRHEGDTMTAQTLRDAAKVLRERAEEAPPGPWTTTAGTTGDPADGPTTYTLRAPTGDIATGEYHHHDGCALDYAATVHPLVGLALADWLDIGATNAEKNGWQPGYLEALEHTPALHIADLILGGAA